MFISHRSLRLVACLLVAGTGLSRVAHGASSAEHATHHGPTADSEPNDHSHHAPGSHDPDDCQICQFIATGSTALAAARPAIITIALPIRHRLAPVVVEPHSADIKLPSAARAPPASNHTV